MQNHKSRNSSQRISWHHLLLCSIRSLLCSFPPFVIIECNHPLFPCVEMSPQSFVATERGECTMKERERERELKMRVRMQEESESLEMCPFSCSWNEKEEWKRTLMTCWGEKKKTKENLWRIPMRSFLYWSICSVVPQTSTCYQLSNESQLTMIIKNPRMDNGSMNWNIYGQFVLWRSLHAGIQDEMRILFLWGKKQKR